MEPAQPSFWAMDKNEDAYRTISEAAEELDLPQHVLRFWETRFPQIKPMKRGGGRRYYRPDDLELLRAIRHLLYGEGYTIKGVQRMLKEQGPRHLAQQVELAAGGHHPHAGGAPLLSMRDDTHDTDPDGQKAELDRAVSKSANVAPLTASRDFAPDAEQSDHSFMRRPVQAASFLTVVDLRALEQALADLDECKRILQSAAD